MKYIMERMVTAALMNLTGRKALEFAPVGVYNDGSKLVYVLTVSTQLKNYATHEVVVTPLEHNNAHEDVVCVLGHYCFDTITEARVDLYERAIRKMDSNTHFGELSTLDEEAPWF